MSEHISLPQFEGPLDLLLDLVRQHRLDILDLPISEVTRQYIDYLHQAKELNIELGADFIFMAATLILIKSGTLLPGDQAEPDAREELVDELISHEQAKQASEFLAARLMETANTWSLPGSLEEFSESNELDEPLGEPEAEPKSGNISLLDALRLVQKAAAVARARRLLNTQHDAMTLEAMIRWLTQQLQQLNGKGFLVLTELFRQHAKSEHRAVLFLALLEMARAQQLQVDQEECFGTIRISPAGAT